jgi:hypothetical protein
MGWQRRRRRGWWGAALVVLGQVSVVRADGLYPAGWAPLPGSVEAQVAEKAARQTATVYGTARSLERNVFPLLDQSEVRFTLTWEQNWLTTAVRVPVVTDEPIGRLRFQSAAMTTYATSIVLGAKLNDTFSLFYGTSLSSAIFMGAGNDNRWLIGSLGGLGLLLYQGPTAPLSVGQHKVLPSIGGSHFGVSSDYVIGGRADAGGTSVYLGYLGSSLGDGVYTNITEEKLRLLLSAALGGKLDDLFYLKAGFDQVRGLLQGDLFRDPKPRSEEEKGVSKTSLFARRLQFLPPQPSVPDDAPRDLRHVSFWTTHLEQLNIGGMVDATLAVSLKPVFVSEATLGLHTPGFNEATASPFGFRVLLGAVELPPMTYFAQPGGRKLMVTAEVKARTSFYLSLRRNDADILSVFPYAYDAWNIYFKMGFS